MTKTYRRPRKLTMAEKILASSNGINPVKNLLVLRECDNQITLLDTATGDEITVERCKKNGRC